ncbi:hypothetical protein BCR43DRAFT_485465 [Syncephalastrum racemosum]|uniref:NodB homology domain-containing protein n=1 Tax=Syncephalastrum racemosum TaxID=13706 RepID=A0A1X2HML6_SYNRA|nr:hypothetical protein BCR43DRAFT_485465 [Syncephalastrum racemosum]
MLPKLFVIAAVTLSAVHAQSAGGTAAAAAQPSSASAFQFKDTYPEPGVIPTPKPEWLELIKNANITKAPVLKSGADGPVQAAGVEGDPYCVWTFTGCIGPDDLSTCPQGNWAMTYDDGPSEFSPKLYDYLDSVNQKVTFFMVGGQVLKYPELAQRAYKAGHDIAMHTWSHSYMTTLTDEQLVAELKWNEQVIKEAIGVSPKYFRPPFGNIDNRVRDISKALGFIPVIWDHDTNDWYLTYEGSGFQESWIDANVTEWASKNATIGGMSLEHDLYNETVNAAVRIFPIMNDAYELKTVSQCSNQSPYKEANATVSSASASASASATGAASKSNSASASTSASSEAQNKSEESGASRMLISASSGLCALVAALWLL